MLRGIGNAGTGIWTPSQLSGLALWLDAADASTITQSGGAITAWADKSGNNRTAIADGNPTYSATGMSTSTPAVQLDGTGDGFVSSITGFGSFNALDVYMVTQTTAAAAPDVNSAFFWAYGNLGSSSGPYLASQGLALSSSTSVLSGELIIILAENATANAGRLGSNSYARAANTAQILNSRNSTTGTSLLANGSSVTLNLATQITTSSNTAPSAIGYTVDSNFHIGALRANGTLLYSPAIKFGEIIVAPTLLSTNDRQRIEGYLAWKWGLVHNLPANHPYRWDGREFGYTFSEITDTDAQTYIAGVETADGQVLENATRTAIQNFIVGAKADGIWDAIKSSAILAGARTLSGALVPLKGTAPTNFNFVSADYNRKTGLIGDGNTKYLDSNRDNNADPQNSRHGSVYVSTAPTTTGFSTYISRGGSNTAGSTIVQIGDSAISGSSTNHLISKVSGSATTLPGTNSQSITLGLKGVSRNTSASHTLRSGNSNFTISDTSAVPLSGNVVIYAAATPAVVAYINARLAFYSIGESLNLALLDARVTALINNVAFAINTGLNPMDYDADTIAYVNAGYAAGGTLA